MIAWDRSRAGLGSSSHSAVGVAQAIRETSARRQAGLPAASQLIRDIGNLQTLEGKVKSVYMCSFAAVSKRVSKCSKRCG